MPARSRIGGKPPELAEAREALRDGRVWCSRGVVVAREDGDHFEILQGDSGAIDVLVEVDLKPAGEPITARLGVPAGGLWAVPAVGAEVLVSIPDGELEHDPVIVALLSTNAVPADLDETTYVMAAPSKMNIRTVGDAMVITAKKKLTLASADEDVEIAAGSGKLVKLAGGGKKIVRDGDTTDNGTLVFVPGTGGASLTYFAPGTAPTIPGGATAITLSGKSVATTTKSESG